MSPANVEIAESSNGNGKALRCTVNATPGTTLVMEWPVLIKNAVTEGTSEQRAQQLVDAFWKLEPQGQRAVLNLFCPDNPLPELQPLLRRFPRDEDRRLLRIFHANGVDLPGGRTGIYLTCGRVNHSCLPNATLRMEDNGVLRLLCIRDITPGEEITASYVSEVDLLAPISHRRRMLRLWGFRCKCERCSGTDDTRTIECPLCEEGYLQPLQNGTWAPCQSCGAQSPQKELQRIEASWWRQWSQLPDNEGSALYGFRGRRYDAVLRDTTSTVALEPPASPLKLQSLGWMSQTLSLHRGLTGKGEAAPSHDKDAASAADAEDGEVKPLPIRHWLAALVSDLAAEAHIWRGEYKEAAGAAQRRIDYVRDVLGGALSFEGAMACATQAVAIALDGETEEAMWLLEGAVREAEKVRSPRNELVSHCRVLLGVLKQSKTRAQHVPREP